MYAQAIVPPYEHLYLSISGYVWHMDRLVHTLAGVPTLAALVREIRVERDPSLWQGTSTCFPAAVLADVTSLRAVEVASQKTHTDGTSSALPRCGAWSRRSE